jgi:hypothetical protein
MRYFVAMRNIFDMSRGDLRKLERFFKESPRYFQRATANVLTSLAFKTRELDIENLNRSMVIRDQRFLRNNLKVQPARSGRIESQVAIAYSVRRPRFTGWKEQQDGSTPEKKRGTTLAARGGNVRGKMQSRARLKSGNKFYKPEQFQGRDLKSRFQFMMRVMGTRGGGEFIITNPVPTKAGAIGKGLYRLRNSKITRLQTFDSNRRPKRIPWRTQSLQSLKTRNDMGTIWRESIKRVLQRYK